MVLNRTPLGAPAALLQHYLATRYVVLDGGGAITLRIGQFSAPLLRLQQERRVAHSAWLTAWNPASERRDEAANQAAQRLLVGQLEQRKLGWLAGRAEDPQGQWPDEPSLWVPGLDAGEARALALRFGQNALLIIGAEAVPRLEWVGPGPGGTG